MKGVKMVKKYFYGKQILLQKIIQNLYFIKLIIHHQEVINFKEILRYQITNLK